MSTDIEKAYDRLSFMNNFNSELEELHAITKEKCQIHLSGGIWNVYKWIPQMEGIYIDEKMKPIYLSASDIETLVSKRTSIMEEYLLEFNELKKKRSAAAIYGEIDE